MQIRLEVGARTAPTELIPFEVGVVEFDEQSVVLSLGGESEVRIDFDDWALGLASIGHWSDDEYVVQSGGLNLVDRPEGPIPATRSRAASPLPPSPARDRSSSAPVRGADVLSTFLFFRIARLEETRGLTALLDEEEEVLYDDRLGFRFRASSENKILWDVTDPFAGFEISIATTRDDDISSHTCEVFMHGNAKYYVIRGMGESEAEDGTYGLRVSEVMFGPEDQNRRCKACEEPEEES
jgi:hypothetical protein